MEDGRGAAGQELGRRRSTPRDRRRGHGDTDNRVAPGNGDFKRGTTLGNI